MKISLTFYEEWISWAIKTAETLIAKAQFTVLLSFIHELMNVLEVAIASWKAFPSNIFDPLKNLRAEMRLVRGAWDSQLERLETRGRPSA